MAWCLAGLSTGRDREGGGSPYFWVLAGTCSSAEKAPAFAGFSWVGAAPPGSPWPGALASDVPFILLLLSSFSQIHPQGILSAHLFSWLPLLPWVNKARYVLVPLVWKETPVFLAMTRNFQERDWHDLP